LIATALEEHPEVVLRAIGAGAINQALKATVRARQFVAGRGEDLVVIPGMKTIQGDRGDAVALMVLRCTLVSRLS
jgi:stage V sporulation protein S